MADTLYVNANVITMNDRQPRADAIAIDDGEILAVGSRLDVEAYRHDGTIVRDLGGKTVVPGFIDAHGHLSLVGLSAVAADLFPPPDGRVRSIATLQQCLRDWIGSSTIPIQYGVILGTGYDESQIEERRHPTRDDLDAVSTDLPVLLVHRSCHVCVLSSRALELMGITAVTPDPEGGVIRRRPGSQEPNGVLEENASVAVLDKLLRELVGPEQALAMTKAGQDLYASFGYTTAQDGGTTPANVAGYIAAAEQGKLALDVVSYVYAPAVPKTDGFMHGPYSGHAYKNRYRIGGVKLILDGSPQGKTAWLTRPYVEPPAGREPAYRGYPLMSNDAVKRYIAQAFVNGWQVLAHANGDAALDQLLDALESVGAAIAGTDRRTVAVHAQTARADQLDRMNELRVIPSFFPAHTFYWGDWHRDSVLGPERADHISPTRWARDRGMLFTSHHDAPVTPPNALRVMWATVNRTTRRGLVLGPEQRVTPKIALKALTAWAAWQYFEEDRKGSIEPGKLADFAVLDQDPLLVEPITIADIRVLETIKEGTSIYRAR